MQGPWGLQTPTDTYSPGVGSQRPRHTPSQNGPLLHSELILFMPHARLGSKRSCTPARCCRRQHSKPQKQPFSSAFFSAAAFSAAASVPGSSMVAAASAATPPSTSTRVLESTQIPAASCVTAAPVPGFTYGVVAAGARSSVIPAGCVGPRRRVIGLHRRLVPRNWPVGGFHLAGGPITAPGALLPSPPHRKDSRR